LNFNTILYPLYLSAPSKGNTYCELLPPITWSNPSPFRPRTEESRVNGGRVRGAGYRGQPRAEGVRKSKKKISECTM
jgi:hypothetical protein